MNSKRTANPTSGPTELARLSHDSALDAADETTSSRPGTLPLVGHARGFFSGFDRSLKLAFSAAPSWRSDNSHQDRALVFHVPEAAPSSSEPNDPPETREAA